MDARARGQDDVIDLVRQLVALGSVNPHFSAVGPGGPGSETSGEVPIATFCARWLTERGLAVSVLEDTPGRPSIVAVARGSGGGRSLMLNGHLDTVGVDGYAGDPLDAVVVGDRILGRGTFDMKGGVAAIMIAAARCAATPVPGDVVVALVADEEFGSIGTTEVLARWSADAAIVVEPSELEVTLAHRGFAWFGLEVLGHAAHGSQPERGIDAVAAAGRILRALDDLDAELRHTEPHPLLGHGSVRVAEIHGGVDAATVAPRARLTIERRFLPGESVDSVEEHLRRVVQEAVIGGRDRRAENGEATIRLTRQVGRSAFEADPHFPHIAALRTAAHATLGVMPGERGEPFWTDAGLYSEAGIPCVVFGVDGGGAHADLEWASVSSIRSVADILERTIRDFCG